MLKGILKVNWNKGEEDRHKTIQCTGCDVLKKSSSISFTDVENDSLDINELTKLEEN